MKQKKKYSQSKVFEFKPDESITTAEIVELTNIIRIGVSGELLENASPSLKKFFIEVKDKKVA